MNATQTAQELTISVSPTEPATPDLANGSIFFVGTATVIVRYAGFTILTDPNFLHKGEQVRIGYGLRSTRRTNPAIEIEDLPPIDLMVLSHMHEDHFDRVAEEKLDKSVPIVSTQHAVTALEKAGFQSLHALETWKSLTFVKGDVQLRITAMPGRHGPGIVSMTLPPVNGSMLEFRRRENNGKNLFRLYITGDTLVHDDLKEIRRLYPDIDLALLHLGGTKVLGLLLTMDANQGVRALQIVRPRTAIPIHYNDYTVFKSPLRDFVKAVREAGLERTVHYMKHGGTYRFEVPQERL